MTHIETARVNEALGLQFGVIRDAAARLSSEDLEQLESTIGEMEQEILKLKGLLEGLPHRHH
ncbi:MAG: hypothetical protein HYS23_01880 [Geobacter sp.]|nr:hypothetical protein [Geobacter sp.]